LTDEWLMLFVRSAKFIHGHVSFSFASRNCC
jgi:hypothetical protein